MKTPLLHVVPVFLATLSFACAPERQAQAGTTRIAAAPTSAHYCNMGVFTPAEHARLEDQLVPKIVAAVTDKHEVDEGYVFAFSGQFKEAGEWVDLVRRCCSTLDYQLKFAPQGGPAELRITGAGPGAKEFIREEFRPILGKGS